MTKAERTRKLIIEKAAPIFNVKGYSNTSLSDIQEATGLTKGAIYGNFSDKNDLALEAYKYSCNLAFEHISSGISKKDSFKEALMCLIECYTKSAQSPALTGGCPMLNAAIEADDYLLFMKKSVQESMIKVINTIKYLIEQGQFKKEFKENISAEFYATTIFSLIEGSIMLSKIMENPEYLRNCNRRIIAIVEQELEI